MLGKKDRICLCLSTLAAALADKAPEEAEVTFVCEGGIYVADDDCFEPIEAVRESLFVEMTRHAGKPKVGPFPLRITHHRIEMTMPGMPATMVGFRQSLNFNGRSRDHLRQIQSAFSTAADTHKKLSVFHRSDHIFHALQVRREVSDVSKNLATKSNVRG